MPISVFSSREFNQDVSKVKKAASSGPVFITDRGRPAHVLLTFAEYKKITAGRSKIAELLSMPDAADIELELERSRDLPQAADLS